MSLIRTALAAVARTTHGMAFFVAAACLPAAMAAETFRAEGADTGAGIGPRYVALGGAGASFADDAYAAVHNPAGLARVQGLQVAISRQLDARLQPFQFIGAAWALPRWGGWDMGLAAAFYPRIHARANGAFDEGDFESLFLRYLLPGIDGTFDGQIETKTRSYRLAWGGAPATRPGWSFGAYAEWIDCRSDFCGVHATSSGFTTQSTGAKAVGLGLGARWQAAPRWTLAAVVNDVNTRLKVKTITTDDLGTRERTDHLAFPRKLALEAAHEHASGWKLAAGYDITRGRYGSSRIDLQVLRLGAERAAAGPWVWRAGAVVPLRIDSSGTGRLRPPAPLSPTLGLGWRSGAVTIDAALYAHPVMSMHAGRARAAADVGASLRF